MAPFEFLMKFQAKRRCGTKFMSEDPAPENAIPGFADRPVATIAQRIPRSYAVFTRPALAIGGMATFCSIQRISAHEPTDPHAAPFVSIM